MTNTKPLSHFDKVSALIDVERVGLYYGPVTPAIQAGLDEGYLSRYVFNSGTVEIRLSTEGVDRLAGFRALLAPLDD